MSPTVRLSPDDLADPPELAESLNSANPRDITDPENVTSSDPNANDPVDNPGIAMTARPDPDGASSSAR